MGRNIVLGAVLGLLVGSGLVLLAESLDRSVESREVLTPGAPNLATIPSLGKLGSPPESLVALHDTSGTSAEAFRTLRAAPQYVAVDDSLSVIQIVSAHSAAAKTTVAANLAITLAQSGQRVAVVDADLRRPRLHQLFGVPQVPGLTSAIIGAATIEQCTHQGQDERSPTPLVVPSGPIPPGPSELLGSSAGARVFDRIRAMVDVVIVDTPPVLPVADTIVLSALRRCVGAGRRRTIDHARRCRAGLRAPGTGRRPGHRHRAQQGPGGAAPSATATAMGMPTRSARLDKSPNPTMPAPARPASVSSR